jgi:hypothetical protein
MGKVLLLRLYKAGSWGRPKGLSDRFCQQKGRKIELGPITFFFLISYSIFVTKLHITSCSELVRCAVRFAGSNPNE